MSRRHSDWSSCSAPVEGLGSLLPIVQPAVTTVPTVAAAAAIVGTSKYASEWLASRFQQVVALEDIRGVTELHLWAPSVLRTFPLRSSVLRSTASPDARIREIRSMLKQGYYVLGIFDHSALPASVLFGKNESHELLIYGYRAGTDPHFVCADFKFDANNVYRTGVRVREGELLRACDRKVGPDYGIALVRLMTDTSGIAFDIQGLRDSLRGFVESCHVDGRSCDWDGSALTTAGFAAYEGIAKEMYRNADKVSTITACAIRDHANSLLRAGTYLLRRRGVWCIAIDGLRRNVEVANALCLRMLLCKYRGRTSDAEVATDLERLAQAHRMAARALLRGLDDGHPRWGQDAVR